MKEPINIHPKILEARSSASLKRQAQKDLCISKDQAFGLSGLQPGTKALFIDIDKIPQASGTGEQEAQSSIIDCKTLQWENDCPRSVGKLKKTDDPNTFYCTQCEQNVYWANSKQARSKFMQLGKNIAFAVDRPMSEETVHPTTQETNHETTHSDKFGLNLVRSILQDNTSLRLARLKQERFDIKVLKRIVLKLTRFKAQMDAGLRDAHTGLRISERDILSIESEIEQELAFRNVLLGQSVLQLLSQVTKMQQELEVLSKDLEQARPTDNSHSESLAKTDPRAQTKALCEVLAFTPL